MPGKKSDLLVPGTEATCPRRKPNWIGLGKNLFSECKTNRARSPGKGTILGIERIQIFQGFSFSFLPIYLKPFVRFEKQTRSADCGDGCNAMKPIQNSIGSGSYAGSSHFSPHQQESQQKVCSRFSFLKFIYNFFSPIILDVDSR